MSGARFSGQARRDVLAAATWIARDRPSIAVEFRDSVREAAELIGRHPDAGRERPELTPLPIRFMPIRRFSHIIVYDPRPRPPMILRVLHGARDLTALFDES